MLGCDPTLYEPPGESAQFRKTDDCLIRYQDVLLKDGTLTKEIIETIGCETDAQIAACWEANIAASYPSREIVLDKSKVYAVPWEGNEA